MISRAVRDLRAQLKQFDKENRSEPFYKRLEAAISAWTPALMTTSIPDDESATSTRRNVSHDNVPQQPPRTFNSLLSSHDHPSFATASVSSWTESLAEPQSAMSDHTGCEIATSLPRLLHALGCSEIPKGVLSCGLSLQTRWNEKGDQTELTLMESGLDEEYVRLFQTELQLDQIISCCIKNETIIQNGTGEDSLTYSVAGDQHSSSDAEELMLPGLIFIAHIFPREENLHSS